MPRLLPDSFQPRLGLTSIEISHEEITPQLPEETGLHPIDASVEAQMEAILQARTFERVVLDALRPSVEDRSMLRPGQFHQIREDLIENLAAQLPSTTEPAARQDLEAALTLLRSLGSDHDLGEQYRYALLKG